MSLNQKLVKEVIYFVEHQIAKDKSVIDALEQINMRQEARGGDLRAILNFINNDVNRYYTLKQDYMLKKEIQAQEAVLQK